MSHSIRAFPDNLGIGVTSFFMILWPYGTYSSSARISLPSRAARPFPVSWQRRISKPTGIQLSRCTELSFLTNQLRTFFVKWGIESKILLSVHYWVSFSEAATIPAKLFSKSPTTPLGTFSVNC